MRRGFSQLHQTSHSCIVQHFHWGNDGSVDKKNWVNRSRLNILALSCSLLKSSQHKLKENMNIEVSPCLRCAFDLELCICIGSAGH
jgi:hypothetical protein